MEQTNDKWYLEPDGISNGVDFIHNTDERAYPLYITNRFGVICGNSSNVHAQATANDMQSLSLRRALHILAINRQFVKEYLPEVDLSDKVGFEKVKALSKYIECDVKFTGRCFDLSNEYGQIVFALWNKVTDEELEAIEADVCEFQEFDKSMCTIALPQDSDGESVDDETLQKNLDRIYQMHNPEHGESRVDFEHRKKEATRGAIDARIAKNLEKRKFADREGYMPEVEYNYRTKRESKENNSEILIDLRDLGNVIKEVIESNLNKRIK